MLAVLERTDLKREILAGLTTFVTMAYIIVVNPKILEAAGIPFGPSMVATILTASFGTILMGLYARRPFAIAPYMGENAFVAYTVVKVLGFSWQVALGAIFLSGLMFAVLTVLGIRGKLVAAVPDSLKIAFTVGIGLFLIFIGLNETGIVALGVSGAPVHVGKLTDPLVALSILGFFGMALLQIWRVPAALLVGILSTTLLAFLFRLSPLPSSWLSLPPALSTFGQLDVLGALQPKVFPVILTMVVMIFVDTMGTLIGVSFRAGLLDERGNLPEIEKPMLCDSLATIFGALCGTTTAGAFIESAAGVEAGGRTGLTAVTAGLLFLVALFFAPLLTMVPACAYGPALILVGMAMLSAIARIRWEDPTETIPVFSSVALMSFTYNLGIGMTAGFVLYPLLKLASGKAKEVPAGLWVLAGISLLFFGLYPY